MLFGGEINITFKKNELVAYVTKGDYHRPVKLYLMNKADDLGKVIHSVLLVNCGRKTEVVA